ncbi:MAG TPA: Rne/Rng family ribonuclease [Candidatus Polarisedimenticolia bacterium]|nr:Rne/Rng family ribonuclease [Candidatus Polarisedimenticolia bacterium]
MSKSMLVNVAAEEEYRVAVVDNGVLDLFEIETLSRENIKGNIYKAVVEGVNSALEASFVNYGGDRAAFLPLDEINFKIYPARFDGGGGKGRGARISRHLEKGMEILVQVVRDAFANKPPTLSTYYSLPGRYLVLMPGADAAGISRKIEDDEQRARLRQVLESLQIPEGYGVIVRTAGLDTSPRELQADLDALLELWRNIERAGADAKAPSLIYQERDLVIRTARDHFTTDMNEVLIDDEATFKRLRKFFEAHMPEKAEVVRLYTGDRPIFSKYNVEDQIEQIYKREVNLKSGGSISIDTTEALTAVDVNSARSSRGGSSEETATRTNLEAAEEIARQLRLRDIGGLIVIDFIDMESSRHIRQVERAFAQSMTRDKARYDVTRISKLGLLEVSRQRMKTTKSASSFKPCPHCSGDGMVRTPESAARAAFRKIQARVARGGLAGVKVYLPNEVAVYLLNEKRDDLYRLESRQRMRIEVLPQEKMRVDQFEIEELRREEPEAVPMVTADIVDQAMTEGTLATPVVGEAPPMLSAADAAARAGERAVERAGERGPDPGRMVEKRAGHPPDDGSPRGPRRDEHRDARGGERPADAGRDARRRRRRRGGRGGRGGERGEQPAAQRGSEHAGRGPEQGGDRPHDRGGEHGDRSRPHREHRHEQRPHRSDAVPAQARPDFSEGPDGSDAQASDAGVSSGQEFEGGASYSGNGAQQAGVAGPQGGEPRREGERHGRRRRRRRGRGRGRGGAPTETGAGAASPSSSSDGASPSSWAAEPVRREHAAPADRWSAPNAPDRYEERIARSSTEPGIERSAPAADSGSASGGGEGSTGDSKPKRRWWRRGTRA